jgi:predicted DNA-binding protein (UPF0251 family)
MAKTVTPENAPKLKGWATASEAAEILDISRQSVNRMINRGEFRTLHALGERPIYLISTTEVEEKKASRAKG